MVRLKHRYITAQILPNEQNAFSKSVSVNQNMFQTNLRDKIKELFGDVGSGDFGGSTFVRFFDTQYSQIMVIRTTRDGEIKVHFALSCITKIESTISSKVASSINNNSEFIIRTLAVNSCVRTCMASLRDILQTYIEHYNQSSDKNSNEATMTKNIDMMLKNTEL